MLLEMQLPIANMQEGKQLQPWTVYSLLKDKAELYTDLEAEKLIYLHCYILLI